MKTTVGRWEDSTCDVFIGRPSKWGNPFHAGRDGTRKEVIRKYYDWILTQPALMNSLHELEGKRLGCFCSPLPCHGDALVKLIEIQQKQNLIGEEDVKE